MEENIEEITFKGTNSKTGEETEIIYSEYTNTFHVYYCHDRYLNDLRDRAYKKNIIEEDV